MKMNFLFKRFLFLFTPVLFSFFSGAQVLQDWEHTYNSPGNGNDRNSILAVDGLGNVYVTGESAGGASGGAVIKYNGEGKVQWIRNVPGAGRGIAADAKGQVYVAGGNESELAIVKYDTKGKLLWDRRYAGPQGGYHVARAITVDKDGNVYVTGESFDGRHPEEGAPLFAHVTIKYDKEGRRQWVARYAAGSPDINAIAVDNLYARGIAVDGSGNVYITGRRTKNPGASPDFVTIKYDRKGKQIWASVYNRGSYDLPVGLAVDYKQNVYVAGVSYGDGTSWDYAVIKYNPDGKEKWVQRYNSFTRGYDIPTSLALDNERNVYVTGESGSDEEETNYATVKYNTDGVRQWVAIYNGPANSTDRGNKLAVDASRNVYVTGYSPGGGATIKYNPQGQQVWMQRFAGNGCEDLALDNQNHVYVTGTQNNDSGEDILTVQYTQFPSAVTSSGAPAGVSGPETERSARFKVSHYPNPVASTARIAYELPFDGQLSLKVYDLMGRTVATLVQAETRAGAYSADFDASRLKKGVYYCRIELRAEKKVLVQTDKIIVAAGQR